MERVAPSERVAEKLARVLKGEVGGEAGELRGLRPPVLMTSDGARRPRRTLCGRLDR
jgi:hypothetical protein